MLPSKETGRKYPDMQNSNHTALKNLTLSKKIMLAATLLLIAICGYAQPGVKTGTVKLIFEHTVNHFPLVLNDSTYTNIFGESYQVTKLKYYISNPGISNATGQQMEKDGYHLVDITNPASQSFSFTVRAGKYDQLFFLLGVDSAHNCSGAQSGSLDPMNDMFWTWLSGYVMMKLEGRSPVSTAINQRMEYHIGGYKSRENTVYRLTLNSGNAFTVSAGKTTVIIIETDLSKWWQLADPVSIKAFPVCTTPGDLAKRIAANYINMFSIRSISNN